MRPLMPHLLKRFDFYSCGSLPGRGNKRINNNLRKWMDEPYEYAAQLDVHHAYKETKTCFVFNALKHLIKDKKYLHLHELILHQMGNNIAIGFEPSHWYFNLILTPIDIKIRKECKEIKMVRYMDNFIILSNTKEVLHKAAKIILEEISKLELNINSNWQIFPTSKRPIEILSYRYFPHYTILKKINMIDLTKRIRHNKQQNAHLSRSFLARLGILKHCNSYNYRKEYIYPFLQIKLLKELVSNADKRSLVCGETR